MTAAPSLFQRLARISLVTQIVIGLIAGILLALLLPEAAKATGFIGKVFVTALKAVAPILVFVLVMASIANHKHGQETHIRPILFLYLLGTFAAAVVAVIASMWFPSSLVLATHDATVSAPGGIGEVLQSLLLSVVDNPVSALMNANFIGILAWAIGMGIAIRHASATTRTVLDDLSNGVTLIVRVVIRFAPLGIFGLVASTLATSGFGALLGYAHLLVVLIGTPAARPARKAGVSGRSTATMYSFSCSFPARKILLTISPSFVRKIRPSDGLSSRPMGKIRSG